MKQTVGTIFFVLLIALSPLHLQAQNNSSFFSRIDRSIARQQPAWKLVKKTIIPNANIAFYEWKSRRSSVAMFIFIKESPEATVETLENLTDVLGLVKSTDKLVNLGDDNYCWKARYTKGNVGVNFRLGRFVASVQARSMADASLFAQLIANEMIAT
jgi:hypothetical protein